ncbi:hypothetical protein VTN96DRAFT_4028 [Rasamsonia emersonii]
MILLSADRTTAQSFRPSAVIGIASRQGAKHSDWLPGLLTSSPPGQLGSVRRLADGAGGAGESGLKRPSRSF